MGFPFRYFVIGATEPVLWVAIVATSVAGAFLGRAIGVRAATNGGRRGVAFGALDLAVLSPLLLVGEVVLLSVLFALKTEGREACLPLVRHLLLVPVAAATLAALLAWGSRRRPSSV